MWQKHGDTQNVTKYMNIISQNFEYQQDIQIYTNTYMAVKGLLATDIER